MTVSKSGISIPTSTPIPSPEKGRNDTTEPLDFPVRGIVSQLPLVVGKVSPPDTISLRGFGALPGTVTTDPVYGPLLEIWWKPR